MIMNVLVMLGYSKDVLEGDLTSEGSKEALERY